MKVAQQTEGMLTLRDTPLLVWLVGVSFIAGGLVAFVSNEKIFGGGFVLAGVGLILGFANTVTSEFNRTTGRFRRTTRGILRNSEIARPLDEIADVDVFASVSGNPSRSYHVALVLASGERLPLTPSYSSGKADKERLAATVREFLGMEKMPTATIPGFTDMVKLMFDPNAAERLGEMFGGSTEALEARVRQDPGNIGARQQLATALAMQNRPEEAREHLTAAREAARSHGNHDLVGQLDVALQKLNDASRRRG